MTPEHNSVEHEHLLDCLIAVLLKLEKVKLTRDGLLSMIQSMTNFFSINLYRLVDQEKEFLKLLENRRDALRDALENQEKLKRVKRTESGNVVGCENDPENVSETFFGVNRNAGGETLTAAKLVSESAQGLANCLKLRRLKKSGRLTHNECSNCWWDIGLGSRYVTRIKQESESRVYDELKALCSRLGQLENIVESLGKDTPRLFRRIIRDGRDLAWLYLSGYADMKWETEMEPLSVLSPVRG